MSEFIVWQHMNKKNESNICLTAEQPTAIKERTLIIQRAIGYEYLQVSEHVSSESVCWKFLKQ